MSRKRARESKDFINESGQKKNSIYLSEKRPSGDKLQGVYFLLDCALKRVQRKIFCLSLFTLVRTVSDLTSLQVVNLDMKGLSNFCPIALT